MNRPHGAECHANYVPYVKITSSFHQGVTRAPGRDCDSVTSIITGHSVTNRLDRLRSAYVIIMTHMSRRRRPTEDAKITALRALIGPLLA